MTKYFWYITIDPKKSKPLYDEMLRSNIKRADRQPYGLFYITEKIADYKHTITDSKNILPPATVNDMGLTKIIISIMHSIESRLINQWNTENDQENEAKYLKRSVIENNFNLMGDDQSPMSMEEISSLRKKSRSAAIKKIKRRVIPCKCKRNIRKVK